MKHSRSGTLAKQSGSRSKRNRSNNLFLHIMTQTNNRR